MTTGLTILRLGIYNTLAASHGAADDVIRTKQVERGSQHAPLLGVRGVTKRSFTDERKAGRGAQGCGAAGAQLDVTGPQDS